MKGEQERDEFFRLARSLFREKEFFFVSFFRARSFNTKPGLSSSPFAPNARATRSTPHT